jgi:hypothetical protein
MGTEEAHRTDDVIAGMFHVNNMYANVLFDLGANKIFVSISFSSCLNGLIDKLANSYLVATADGLEVIVETILRNLSH